MSMGNMRRRQKLYIESTMGRLNNLDRGLANVKIRAEMYKLKEDIEINRKKSNANGKSYSINPLKFKPSSQ